MTGLEAAAVVAVTALMTAATRWAPFLLFGGGRRLPRLVVTLGRLLPAAIMATLTVYCLKSVDLAAFSGWSALIAVGVVAALHLWKRNVLLSIAAGTALYMLLIRL